MNDTASASRYISVAKRKVLATATHCFYCQVELQDVNNYTDYLKIRAIDHLIPHSRGGGNELDNLVACCNYCNTLKRDMTPAEFCSYLDNKMKQMALKYQKLHTIYFNAVQAI